MTVATPPIPTNLPRLLLDPESIHLDAHNHRIADSTDAALLASLAESIKINGQQQPGLVCLCPPGLAKKGESYRLVFGFRRQAACAAAGVQFAADFVDRVLSDEEILSLRATENLDRDNLNPVEECLAVAKLAEAFDEGGPLEPEQVQQKIADRLGRPIQWVRDRLYVHRLPKKVKELVASQEIPLTYARELAKVADPGRCEDLAEDVLTHKGDGSPRRLFRSLSWLQHRVQEERWSLKVVPWDVRVAFAGKPACTDCPHNTANDMALFEHDPKKSLPELQGVKVVGGEEVQVGLCLNKACHQHKDAAAMKALKAGVAKARAAVKKGTSAGPAGLTEAGLVPKGVKATTFARWVGSAPEETDKAKGKKADQAGEYTWKPTPEVEHLRRVREWAILNFQEAAKRINGSATARAYMAMQLLVHDRHGFRLEPKHYREAILATRETLDKLLTAMLKEPPQFESEWVDYEAKNADSSITILQHLGLKVPPKPELKAEKPAKRAKKKGAKA